LVFHS